MYNYPFQRLRHVLKAVLLGNIAIPLDRVLTNTGLAFNPA
jgi:hypothetical protein